MFYQIFASPQERRCVIITYKDGMYELPHELPNEFPHELPNDLGLRILGNEDTLGTCLNLIV